MTLLISVKLVITAESKQAGCQWVRMTLPVDKIKRPGHQTNQLHLESIKVKDLGLGSSFDKAQVGSGLNQSIAQTFQLT